MPTTHKPVTQQQEQAQLAPVMVSCPDLLSSRGSVTAAVVERKATAQGRYSVVPQEIQTYPLAGVHHPERRDATWQGLEHDSEWNCEEGGGLEKASILIPGPGVSGSQTGLDWPGLKRSKAASAGAGPWAPGLRAAQFKADKPERWRLAPAAQE